MSYLLLQLQLKIYLSNFNLSNLHVGLLITVLGNIRLTDIIQLKVNMNQRRRWILTRFATYQNNIHYWYVQLLFTVSVWVNISNKISTLVHQQHFQYCLESLDIDTSSLTIPRTVLAACGMPNQTYSVFAS